MPGGAGGGGNVGGGGGGGGTRTRMESWGADKPFANMTENTSTAKNIALTVREEGVCIKCHNLLTSHSTSQRVKYSVVTNRHVLPAMTPVKDDDGGIGFCFVIGGT